MKTMSYKEELQIIFEDDDILAVNKQAGLIVNRSDTTAQIETLQDLVEKYLSFRSDQSAQTKNEEQDHRKIEQNWESPEEAFMNRSGIVHRLDKETSGVILIAKNLSAFFSLQKEFKERVVKKTYQALAHGKITPLEGTINVPVGRLQYNRKRFGIVAGGRESVTLYKVLYYCTNPKTKETLSYVELYPKTGRTHQIRVHLQYIGHPIFADELYAGRKISREDRKILPRVFLHATSITFVHPTIGKRMKLTAPLPNELNAILEHFR